MDALIGGVLAALVAITIRELVSWARSRYDAFRGRLGLLSSLRNELVFNRDLPPWTEAVPSDSVWQLVMRDGVQVPINDEVKQKLFHLYAHIGLVRLVAQLGREEQAKSWYKDGRVSGAIPQVIADLDAGIEAYKKRKWWLIWSGV